MNATRWIMGITALAAASLPAAAEVNVKFVEPDRYSDSGSLFDRKGVLDGLERHLKWLGDRYLAAGQVLQVDVLDVDLAGRMEASRGALPELRVVRSGADWPRIRLQYTLKSGDKVLKEGKDDVADMNYLVQGPSRYRNEPLAYERYMLEEWFKAKFAGK